MTSFKEVVSKHAPSAFEKHLLSAMDNDDFVFFNFIETYPGFLGYHPNYNGKIYIAEGFPNLWHEISHLVEIDEERFMVKDFGLGGRPTDKQFNNKKFMIKMTAREERVVGIGKVISMGNNPNVTKEMSKVNYNPCLFRKFNELGFPIFKFKNIEEVKEWGFHVMKTATETWTQDKIEHIFFKRIETLRNNLHKSIKIAALAVCMLLLLISNKREQNEFIFCNLQN